MLSMQPARHRAGFLAIVLFSLANPTFFIAQQPTAVETISLTEALHRAQQNEPAFAAALSPLPQWYSYLRS